ncbi:hypothetical protein ScPMuIL_015562 [Solemya velum]
MPVIKRGEPGSYFGFSVAEHQVVDDASSSNPRVIKNLLLIGAPQANVSVLNVLRPGDIYQCDARSALKDDCERIEGPSEADTENPSSDPIDRYTDGRRDQWLGNNIFSQGTGKKVVVCAHRYSKRQGAFHFLLGKCVLLDQNLNNFETINPCAGRKFEPGLRGLADNYRMCQAGTSSMLTDETQFVVGAPGSILSTGQMFHQYEGDELRSSGTFHTEVRNGLAPVDTNSYLGYSVTAGRYDASKQWRYVAGAPRANNSGVVIVFTTNTASTMTFKPGNVATGKNDFAGFGNSLLTVDVNNDGFDDLIVGAPFYYDKYKGGAFFVYLGGDSISAFPNETKMQTILSREMSVDECEKLGCEHARFGFSLAKAGDVNRDGFEDIAVGAPYEGDGAVYIFHGGPDGLKTKYAQRIEAGEMAQHVPSGSVSSFDYSLAGGMDLDENGYADVVVGAYDVDMVFLLRTKPIIHLKSNIEVSPKKLPYTPDENPVCQFDNMARFCVRIKICLKFTAEPVERFTTSQDIKYRIDAEPQKIDKRVEFKNPSDSTNNFVERVMTLQRQANDRYQCKTEIVYLKELVQDLLSSIVLNFTYTLIETVPDPALPGQLPDINQYPILLLDGDGKATTEFQIEFKKDCGDNEICESNLYLGVETSLKKDKSGTSILRKGEVEYVSLIVLVKNTGEPAYAVNYYLTIPKGLSWQKTESIEPVGKILNCSLFTPTLLCKNIGNPLKPGASLRLNVTLQVVETKAADNMLVLKSLVNTTSKEESPGDMIPTRISIMTVADPYLKQGSNPPTVIYQGDVIGASAVEFDAQIGPAINHTYVVENSGPGIVDNLRVTIHWPYEMESEYEHGKYLLYLMEFPVLTGPVTCNTDPDIVNELKVKKSPRYYSSEEKRSGPSYNVPAADTEANRRRKREATKREAGPRVAEVKTPNAMVLDCRTGNARCHKIHCDVSKLKAKKYAVITLVGRLWKSTFLEDFRDVEAVKIHSYAVLKVDPTYYIQNDTNDRISASTIAYPDIKIGPSEGIAWWIILIAVIGGILLVVLLVIILWKLGFFRRKKRDEMRTYEARVEKKKDHKEDEA